MATRVFPEVRDIVRSFVLPDERGERVDLESFRQQRNLVLLFIGEIGPAADSMLRGLATVSEALAAEDAVVLAVVRGSRREASLLRERLASPFPVLADETGEVVGSFCSDSLSIYITDRFREIFAVHHGDQQVSPDGILEWLAHINRQCPE